jgi:hypothetical protein
MKAPDILGLVIRIAGFLLVLYGLWYVLYGVESIPSALLGRAGDSDESPMGYLEFGIPVCVIGTVFFLFADWFVSLSYRSKHD